jgi:contact-dependent growth inhibition (CDI) system CdiI-like immunity protein
MFSIRFFTPAVVNEAGWPHAGAELVVGDGRVCFLVDLSYWSIPAYQHQWREGITRLVEGAPSTALMSAYRGQSELAHVMFALWRDNGHVYVQEQSVVPADLDGPFDPGALYGYVGERIPVSEYALPIPEWRCDIEHVHAANLGIRWPRLPGGSA